MRLIDPAGISHTICEVPQTKLIKQTASLNGASPLQLDAKTTIQLRNEDGICLRIEGEFWNANRFWDDARGGKIDEPICLRQGKWRPTSTLSRHLTGGGADWEIFFKVSGSR